MITFEVTRCWMKSPCLSGKTDFPMPDPLCLTPDMSVHMFICSLGRITNYSSVNMFTCFYMFTWINDKWLMTSLTCRYVGNVMQLRTNPPLVGRHGRSTINAVGFFSRGQSVVLWVVGHGWCTCCVWCIPLTLLILRASSQESSWYLPPPLRTLHAYSGTN